LLKVSIVFTLILTAAAPAADPPRFDWVFPAGGQQGTTVEAALGGKLDPWPVKVWIDTTGITIKPGEKKGDLTFEIGKDVPVGVHHLRLHTDEGASWPRWFIVGQIPEIRETEPNDQFKTEAPPLENFPVTINGKFERSGGDVDSYGVQLEAGQVLVASVEAYNIGADIDPILHVLDPDGTQHALNNDHNGLDSLLAFRAPKAGKYILQAYGFAEPRRADVSFYSSSQAVYRLTVTTGPFARHAFPAGVQRGRKTALHLYGWNIGSTGNAVVRTVDASNLDPSAQQITFVAPDWPNRLDLPVSDAPEQREVEPNDMPDLALPVAAPCVVNGRIDPPGDVDRVMLTAKKGEAFVVSLASGRLGFPLDAVVRIQDDKNKELVRDDDRAGTGDPQFDWSAPEDGAYFLTVSDLYDNGSPDHIYRLAIERPTPDFTATVNDHAFRMLPGESAEMTVTVALQHGYTGNISAMVDQLPAGVTATAAVVPAKGGAVQLKLTAAPDAKPAGGPVRVIAVDTQASPPRLRQATAGIIANTDAKSGPIDKTPKIWVAVTPKPPPPEPKKEEEKKE
jgi:hypothetical protein